MTSVVRAVIDDGRISTRFPAANAEAAGTNVNCSGKFHGPMIPTTPSGSCRTRCLNPINPCTRADGVSFIHSLTPRRWWVMSMRHPATSAVMLNSAGRVPKSAVNAAQISSELSSRSDPSRVMRSIRVLASGMPSRRNAACWISSSSANE